ncbi:MAG TPA: fumarylacetoacetate hydrolase family protein [Alphaproteobacteria bacterium]|nr:fumarylacetoacetate hydrolase family protein [Alphaproteobacteria bacterium]
MALLNVANAVEAFWQERAKGVYFPPAWSGKLSIDEAYKIQLGLIAKRAAAGERQVGWKVGLTATAIQEQFRVHEPVFGCLLGEGVKQSGHAFNHGTLIKPGFENEVCVRLGRDLTASRVRLEDVRQAIETCYPALEITETRGDFTADLPLALADNAQQKAVVLGAAVRYSPELDLAAIAVQIVINGKEVASGKGDAVLGNPLNSVVWLAEKLSTFGRRLKAGDLIMTGSFTRQFPIAKGERIRTEFERLGAVEANFT